MTPSCSAKLVIKKLREYKKSCSDPEDDVVEFKDQISFTGIGKYIKTGILLHITLTHI